MADEISVQVRVTATKSNVKLADFTPGALAFDMTGDRADGQVQDIGHAAHEALNISGDIATKGWFWFRNLDSANYVEIGVDVAGAFHAIAKAKAGEVGAFRLATGSPYAKADTAGVKLQFGVLED